jgi:hypothetical protein
MDRCFLSQAEVVAASRRFVCVRLLTYEDRTEGAFLKSLVRTRSGELENTVFALLSPDGKQVLTRASRSARHTFGDARQLAETMDRCAGRYAAREFPAALPAVPSVRLALNVAACDHRPLVVAFAPEAMARRRLAERLASLVWDERFRGRFTYVTAAAATELSAIQDAPTEAGVFVVQPDRFGLAGKALKQVGAEAPPAALAACLTYGLALHRPSDEAFGEHVRDGHQQGVFWETIIPVTDPMERQARERGRRLGPGLK